MPHKILTLDEEIEDAIVNNLGDQRAEENGEDTMETTVKVLHKIIDREKELSYREGWQKAMSQENPPEAKR